MSGKRRKESFVADFETTTDPADCRVWVWGIVSVDKSQGLYDVDTGLDIGSFMAHLETLGDAIVYFHNLKFDGIFILDWLYRSGYVYTTDRPVKEGAFTTLISKMGSFYTITVTLFNGTEIEFRDSFKKLPFKVSRIAKAFKLEESKGDIDYHKPRPVGYEPTPEEYDYLYRDVIIVAKALKIQFDQGMTKLTIGSDSMTEYKRGVSRKKFERLFPVLPFDTDSEIRSAYRGGFTYADPRFQGKPTGCGRVYDVNSLYPAVMYSEVLPYGKPVFVDGLPQVSDDYPLFIVSITFTAKLKPKHIPCIQVRGSSHFLNTEYQREIKDPITLSCSSVDLALWQDHYDLNILQYNGGWKFKATTGMFKEFIDKWSEIKANNTGALRELAKLQLNNLYGKYASNPDVTGKYPVMEDNRIKLVTGEPDTKDPVYTAMGVFITSYARDKTIRAAQAHYDVFAYADTDSLHLLITEDPDDLEIHPTKLGAWKFEYAFESAMFARAKRYSERLYDGSYVTHVAGLQTDISETLTFEDFRPGNKIPGKLLPKRVPGGVVLMETDFTMDK